MSTRDHYTQQLEALHAELRSLGQLVVAAITWSLGAFNHHDTTIAQRVVADDHAVDHAQYTLEEHMGTADDQVDALDKPVRGELIERLQQEAVNASQLADLLAVTHNLERIADRTTNIAERVVFLVSGTHVELSP
jgi:phosphate uptake regulator